MQHSSFHGYLWAKEQAIFSKTKMNPENYFNEPARNKKSKYRKP